MVQLCSFARGCPLFSTPFNEVKTLADPESSAVEGCQLTALLIEQLHSCERRLELHTFMAVTEG